MSVRAGLAAAALGGALAGIFVAEARLPAYLAVRERLAGLAGHEIGAAARQRYLDRFRQIAPDVQLAVLGDSHAARGPWAELLPGTDVANRGIPGETVAEMLTRLESTLATRPEIVMIQAGTNDLRQGADASATAAAVADLGDRLEAAGVEVVLSTVPLCRAHFCDPARFERFNTALRDLAALRTWPLVDLAAGLEDSDVPVFEGDALHLLPEGYVLWRAQLCAGVPLEGC